LFFIIFSRFWMRLGFEGIRKIKFYFANIPVSSMPGHLYEDSVPMNASLGQVVVPEAQTMLFSPNPTSNGHNWSRAVQCYYNFGIGSQ
jgi:hypothetical protein